jgi:hypothetical protein
MTLHVRPPLLIGVIGIVILAFTAAKFSYHSTCSRCLTRLEGYNFKVAGVTILSQQRELAEDSGGGRAATYRTIFGSSCPHSFDVGRVEWKGLVSSGQLPAAELHAYTPRLQAVEALLDLQRRLPNPANGRVSYLQIDTLLPEGLSSSEMQTAAFGLSRRAKDLATLSGLLDRVVSEEEWLQVIEFAQNGYRGEAPALEESIVPRLYVRDGPPAVSRRAVLRLLKMHPALRWPLMEFHLKGTDEEMIRSAAFLATTQRRYEAMPQLLRLPKDAWLQAQWTEYVSDEDLSLLLKSKEQKILSFCEEVILRGYRIHWLQPLLNLSQSPSRQQRLCLEIVNGLLHGPDIYDNSLAYWDNLPEVSSVGEAIEIIALPRSPQNGDERTLKVAWACKKLALNGQPHHWPILQMVYSRDTAEATWVTVGLGIMGRAMAALDADRTFTFLTEELKNASTEFRQDSVLAAIGLIADPRYLPALERFEQGLPRPGPGSPQHPPLAPGATITHLKYAQHRCRQIDLQKIDRRDGRYVLVKSNGI